MSAHDPHSDIRPGAGQGRPAPADDGALIRLEGVTKRFGDHTVFQDLTLGFRRGETTVVLGASGVGKSVMLKLILGLLPPDAGRIFVDHTDITDLDERALIPIRQRFGMVFQGAALFDFLTVYENVAFAIREHKDWPESRIRETVAAKLATVGLEGTEDLLPEELSGGMRKRVGLARAIAIDPEVILYDEPTTGLDPVTADTINSLIVRCQQKLKTTSIVVTHDMASAFKVGDRLVMLDEGRLIADGTPEQIRSHSDVRVQRFIHGDASLAAPPNEGAQR
jgi:phospholipid/cholesterol/gamma-HCH transport system ATP-binding protein